MLFRSGRSLLELGGNNAIIVEADADVDVALRAILFGAVGTAGQRCTTTRRVFLHKDIAARFTEHLVKLYSQIRIGDPLADGTLMGPLIDEDAVLSFETAVAEAQRQGGTVLCGGRRLDGPGHYVLPTIIAADPTMTICGHETFAPILYVMEYSDLDEAIGMNNGVTQGLSSSIFTRS